MKVIAYKLILCQSLRGDDKVRKVVSAEGSRLLTPETLWGHCEVVAWQSSEVKDVIK